MENAKKLENELLHDVVGGGNDKAQNGLCKHNWQWLGTHCQHNNEGIQIDYIEYRCSKCKSMKYERHNWGTGKTEVVSKAEYDANV